MQKVFFTAAIMMMICILGVGMASNQKDAQPQSQQNGQQRDAQQPQSQPNGQQKDGEPQSQQTLQTQTGRDDRNRPMKGDSAKAANPAAQKGSLNDLEGDPQAPQNMVEYGGGG